MYEIYLNLVEIFLVYRQTIIRALKKVRHRLQS